MQDPYLKPDESKSDGISSFGSGVRDTTQVPYLRCESRSDGMSEGGASDGAARRVKIAAKSGIVDGQSRSVTLQHTERSILYAQSAGVNHLLAKG
jgi:hypothetical protein